MQQKVFDAIFVLKLIKNYFLFTFYCLLHDLIGKGECKQMRSLAQDIFLFASMMASNGFFLSIISIIVKGMTVCSNLT